MSQTGQGWAVEFLAIRELEKSLRRLTEKNVKRVTRKGCRAGAKVIHKEVIGNVGRITKHRVKGGPAGRVEFRTKHGARTLVRSGRLAASIKVRAMRRSRKAVGVHVMSGEGWFKGPTFYAAFAELGHRQGRRLRKSLKRGWRRLFARRDRRRKVPGMRFMRDAAVAKKQQATKAMFETTWAEIKKLVR
jgi:hypothetical protein